jgi:AraC family transcriptional regulator of adaptative response/methylated-DNA-[protein]-cysteine methyltransferase
MNETTQAPMLLPDEAACWQAVIERDAQFDLRFFYAVRSTGIFCRPSCPSRRPRREQVSFYATRAAAVAAGYRPCKRCQPDRDLSAQAELVQEAIRLIESAEDMPRLADLGRQLHSSPFHLQRVFKAATGLSPRQYAAGLRASRLKQQLRGGQNVTGALYAAGYGSPSRLHADAQVHLGMTPSLYRSGGQNMQIEYTLSDCPLGRMLVAATPRGVCAVSLGGDDAALEDGLRQEYPGAQIAPAAQGLRREVECLLDYLNGRQTGLDLPLDVQATAFQLRVWEELRRIPYGETRSYTQVAAAIGRPRAVRAVANACASNPAALVTPCHRVIRGDGTLGGYRWGLERKKTLLSEEHARKAQSEQPGA